MNKQDHAHSTAEKSTGAPTRIGAIRRFFNTWRRWEEAMDYTPYDYTLDRIRQLERRVLEMERVRNAMDAGDSEYGDGTISIIDVPATSHR